MAVTRSSALERTRQAPAQPRIFSWRAQELFLLAAVSVVLIAGIVLTVQGRTGRMETPTRSPLNLTQVDRREQLLPYLQAIDSPAERQFIAQHIFDAIQEHGRKLPNVGALGLIRIPVNDVLGARGLPDLQKRAQQHSRQATMPLLTGAELSALKPFFIVRDAAHFRRALIGWCIALFLAFYVVHIFWTYRAGGAPQYVLPAVHLISGIGLIAMITLRDPLRDTLSFADFGEGVILGCIALAACSLLDYRRLAGRLSYIPLLASFLLSLALIAFGSGPSGSDAKVNLFGFQPAELIRVLIVFFLAGYFATRWEFLRTLTETRAEVARVSRWVEVPRLEYLLPVICGVVASLAFFFLQKDLGPALIIASLFLTMYAVARDRYLFAAAGLALILSGFLIGYLLGFPRTVSARVSMWLSPWDNAVRGGQQVVHALWGFATGGLAGTGLGLGDPEIMPAAHTDLVLAVIGEEWGLIGVLTVLAIYTVLVWFGLRAAMRARSDYSFFLGLGLTLTVGLQVALISGGVLGLLPLSGVVMPFLSYGRTALVTNFAIVGMLVAIWSERSDEDIARPFRATVRTIGIVLGVFGVALAAKAAYVQAFRADPVAGAGALTVQADGGRRYEYNPRLLAIARSIRRGTIYDRNGLPLATSNWDALAENQEAYKRIGVVLPPTHPAEETRFYPLGPYAVHLLGDLRTRANWSARNTSLAERDFAVALQGYDDRATVAAVPDPRTGKPAYTIRYDFRELLPLLRHRYEPDNPAVKRVRDRDRNLHMSIDAALQIKASEILKAELQRLGKSKGAVVVMDARTGDLLASVSYPWPAEMPPTLNEPDSDDTMFDRARYGLYPPGSSFKVVTAIAALRKDPNNANQQFECKRLPDGRNGNYVRGSSRPIRDDVKDVNPHGTIAMRSAVTVSCNAYFAQLASYNVGAEALLETAGQLGISAANPATPQELKKGLAQAGYGQGEVVATPFQMARVAATVANSGMMPYGRWVTDRNNPRQQAAQPIIAPQLADMIGGFMRNVVTAGTGRAAAASGIDLAGKTGTAEVTGAPSHAWFIGYGPYTPGQGGRRLAFAVVVENGQYGGTASAPIAAQVMKAARDLGLFGRGG